MTARKPFYTRFKSLIILTLLFAVSCAQEEPESLLGESCLSLSASVGASPADSIDPVDYDRFSDLQIPPLTPEQSMDHFQLEEGFSIEMIAHEPLVVDPVAIDIDPDGRLWVVGMPAYNHNAREILETTGERTPEREQMLRESMEEAPRAEIAVLEDTNGDGIYDSKRIFMDDLNFPRAIRVLHDGVLLGEPPNLWFIRDTNGDGRGDSKELLSDEYMTPRSPQSGPNTLLWGPDNWIHSSEFPSLRRIDGEWVERTIEPVGQWGISRDDWGRLYSSSNSWPLHAHLIPYGYSDGHPDFDISTGLNERIAPNEPIWPAQPTGVNRGYRVSEVTREDGTIKMGAGISSTVIYRGNQFGEAYRGNAFSPVGGGNLIKRVVIDGSPDDIDAEGRFAYEEREFLTSTDERFRPVNLYNAPDGSIYVLDLYRGLYDYVLWTSDYLRDYVLERGLDQPMATFGRIYRIYNEENEISRETPRFSELTPSEAASYLTSENGAIRDIAQQVLAECSPSSAVGPLEEIARDSNVASWSRFQALWTLEGMERSVYSQARLTDLASDLLNDSHARVRAAAVQILEPAIEDGDQDVLGRVIDLAEQESAPAVHIQLVASLGRSADTDVVPALAYLIDQHREDPRFIEMGLVASLGKEAALAALLQSDYEWIPGEESTSEEMLTLLLASADETPADQPEELTGRAGELFTEGASAYAVCSACHGGRGQGVDGVGSAMAGSDWVTGDPESLIRIMLQGFDGGAAERGEVIPNDMPSHAFLSDEQLAAILTYIRNAWGNEASPIMPEEIEQMREETAGRSDIWTPDELREARE